MNGPQKTPSFDDVAEAYYPDPSRKLCVRIVSDSELSHVILGELTQRCELAGSQHRVDLSFPLRLVAVVRGHIATNAKNKISHLAGDFRVTALEASPVCSRRLHERAHG